jgi:pre-mRNA-splicing factor SPF27
LARRLEARLAAAKAAVEETNRERKLAQAAGGRELAGYESQWAATVAKNAEIEAACDELSCDLAALCAQLPAP